MMTRDAKIGLLVGLAFILIVGILLSEHITAATAPQQASLAQAGDRVRRAVSAPIAPQPALEPVSVDPNPQPKVSVVTRDVIDSPQLPPTARIELGPAQGGQIKVIRVDTPKDSIASAVQVEPMRPETAMLAATTKEQTKEVARDSAKAAGSPSAHPLQDAARAGGMELVDVKTITAPGASKSDAKRTELPPIANGSKVREYVAQPGDSLSKIASHQLGASTPANRAAIVALNPSLQKDESRILVGAKYLIPADAWEAALGSGGGTTAAEPAKPAAPPASTTAVTTATITYTVQPGDSLWKIADREVGSSGALAQVKAMNADVLGDGETVKVGMKLKLPVKK